MLELKPSFLGKCYSCKKEAEIVNCTSWGTQGGGKNKVFGSFRNFCGPCEKDFGVGVNRAVNVKALAELPKTTKLSEYHKCSKCRMYYKKTNNFGSICLLCYGRKKYGDK